MKKKSKKDIYLNNPNLPAVGATFEFTPEMVEDLKRCKDDIIYFAENFFYIVNPDTGKQKIPLYEYQKKALQMMKDNRFTMLLFSRQTGKALDVDTPIPTPNGFVRMGDLKDGDEVYDENGKVIKILLAHEVMYGRDCYEVVFDNGEKIVADGEHLWSVDAGVVTTEQLEVGNFTVSHCDFIDSVVTPAEDCRYIRKHTIKAINRVESRPVRCITVDSPTSLYLAGKTGIPTHNSTISTILCLWYACFNDDQNIIIVANKEATAKSIFKRMRMAYEMLPNWLKPACKEYGKESMELANGSHVGITTTTGTAGRGSTANCVHGDSLVQFVGKDGFIYEIPIRSLYNYYGKSLEGNVKFMQVA